MKNFTGWEWLLIDAANQADKDKLTFEERIQWTMDHFDQLEDLVNVVPIKTRPLYIKAVAAIRKAQKGIPTGHLVGVDGVCSGVQIMSTITGCEVGAEATGLINPDVRADAYSALTDNMNHILGNSLKVSRKDAKAAMMTSFYGSKATPKAIFGEDTPELQAFYKAAKQTAPGAWDLLQVLLASWNKYEPYHQWTLPDGYVAHVKVLVEKEARIEVDELDHATFSHTYYVNEGTDYGLSNVANVTHSLDAYVLRTVHRRCNYDKDLISKANVMLEMEVDMRDKYNTQDYTGEVDTELSVLLDKYSRTKMADISVLPHINDLNIYQVPTALIKKLFVITTDMLKYEPFEVVTIHDEFKAHPNNINHLRYTYKEILADLADSEVLTDILQQLFKVEDTWVKMSPNLGDKIRQSNYALC